MKLWNADHPYYCTDGNYRANSILHPEVLVQHDSWAEFAVEYGWLDERGTYFNSDPDLNLLFRWDWQRADPSDYEEGEELPADSLHLYFVLQRKADIRTVVINNVTENDEPAIRSWLTERAKTMAAIWEPIGLKWVADEQVSK